MAAQKGFEYEKNASDFLKSKSLVDKNFRPAGAGHSQADLEVTHNKEVIDVELKITAASGGSLVLKYFKDRPNGKKWDFDTIPSTDKEKQFLADLARQVGALDKINKLWTNKPMKTNPQESNGIPKNKWYDIDKTNFDEINENIDAQYMADYYEKKNTYYVNVGDRGFYIFGKKDPKRLNQKLLKVGMSKIPSFADKASLKYRARVQSKGGGNYQYTFELSFSISTANKSPYNIAPIDGKSVNILENNFVNPFV